MYRMRRRVGDDDVVERCGACSAAAAAQRPVHIQRRVATFQVNVQRAAGVGEVHRVRRAARRHLRQPIESALFRLHIAD